ncbi:hypothetical protein NDU88_000745 [Pleurodeles waltl]|uniref:Uncharacterized protein n=1 Tax=Pleurodeles waltl TaxID=8319 RepID=A0AAV7TI49_PLEWA|nr:hypothetical protein NDU88_000745 [Pleurodeles waltl]
MPPASSRLSRSLLGDGRVSWHVPVFSRSRVLSAPTPGAGADRPAIGAHQLRRPTCCCVSLGLAPRDSAARPRHSFDPVSALWPQRRHLLSGSAPGLSYPVFSLPDSGRRYRLSGDQGPLAPPASLLLCFFGARSLSLSSTPSALLQPSERPLTPAPSTAKPLRFRSLLFLVCRRPSLRWPHAHTRVPGCTGPTEQTAPKFPNLHRSLSASLRSGSTVLQCPPQLSHSAIAGADLWGRRCVPVGLRPSARRITCSTHPTPGRRFRASAISFLCSPVKFLCVQRVRSRVLSAPTPGAGADRPAIGAHQLRRPTCCCVSLGLAPRDSAARPRHSFDPVSALWPQRRHLLSGSAPGLSCSSCAAGPLFAGCVLILGSPAAQGPLSRQLIVPSLPESHRRSVSLYSSPGSDPVFSLPDSGRRYRLSGDQGPLAPPASLLLCFFGARSLSLSSTPSALLQPSERPLTPAPSTAKPLRFRSLLFLVCRRPSLRWPHAHTRVPGCTGPTEQTAPKFPNLHRSLSASLRSGSTVLQCPPQLSHSAIAVCPQGWV